MSWLVQTWYCFCLWYRKLWARKFHKKKFSWLVISSLLAEHDNCSSTKNFTGNYPGKFSLKAWVGDFRVKKILGRKFSRLYNMLRKGTKNVTSTKFILLKRLQSLAKFPFLNINNNITYSWLTTCSTEKMLYISLQKPIDLHHSLLPFLYRFSM